MPLSWKWLGIYVAAAALLLALQLVPGFDSKFLPLQVVHPPDETEILNELQALKADDTGDPMPDPREEITAIARRAELESRLERLRADHISDDQTYLASDGGLVGLVAPVLLWIIPAGVIGVLARRRLHRELMLGGVALILVQWLIWIARVKGEVGPLISSKVKMYSEGGGMVLPPLIGLLVLNILAMLLATGTGAAANAIASRARGEVPPDDQRKTTRWGRVAASVVGTTLLFVLFVRFVGPMLHFYWSCDFHHPSSTCQAGIDRYYQSLPSDRPYFWQKDLGDTTPGVILDSFRYVMLCALVFAIGPLVIGLTTRRGRGVTAAWAAFLVWPVTSLAALILLGFGQFDSVIVLSVRLHVLAGIPWCAAGLLGAWLGNKLGPKIDLAEELGIELNPPEPARDYTSW
jgi:hypothetical protein